MEADSRSDVIAALLAGLLAGYGIAMPVGAVAAFLVALTARTSLRIGVLALRGGAAAIRQYRRLQTSRPTVRHRLALSGPIWGCWG